MSQTPCLYQETRLNLDPASPDSIVEVQIPSNGLFASRLSPKRRRLDRAPQDHDEETFSRYHLASDSSIHFRSKSKHVKPEPRAILWRLLDERTLLELQAVDLYQDKEEKNEPVLTLRFSFADSIRPAGVAFAEKETGPGRSALVVFVLTKAAAVHSFTLTKKHFVKPGVLQDGAARGADWCKSFTSGSLLHRNPFKMLAKSDKEVWISCADGGLAKLESQNGSNWRETAYTEGGWTGSIRGLIPWKAPKTVRYDDADLTADTATSFAFSPAGQHILSIGLDHTIRIWSLPKGKVVANWDMGGDDERDLKQPPEVLLQPSHAQRLQIIPGKHEDEFHLFTFSPRTRAFKLWAVKIDGDGDVDYSEAKPDVDFLPPAELRDAAVWNLESFYVTTPKAKSPDWRLWMMVRSGPRSQAYSTSFNLDAHSNSLTRAWRDNWVCVDSGFASSQALQANMYNPMNVDETALQQDTTGPAERWLSFLFYPGRFTNATLETALFIYRRSLGTSGTASDRRLADTRSGSLRTRVSETIGCRVYLGPIDDEATAFERHQRAIDAQWRIFYGVIKDLHARREEIFSVAVDPEEHLPWLIGADYISPIRVCGEAEILWHNQDNVPTQRDLNVDHPLTRALEGADQEGAHKLALSQLFFALETFHTCLSASFVQSFVAIIDGEVFRYPSEEAPSRIQSIYEGTSGASRVQSIYERSGFAEQVSDDDYGILSDALAARGGFVDLGTNYLTSILDLFDGVEEGRHHLKNAQTLTQYGAKTLMRGSQELLELCNNVIIDLLLFVVFTGNELEEGDLAEDFNADETFEILTARLRAVRLLQWLGSAVSASEPTSPKSSTTLAEPNTLVSLPTKDERAPMPNKTLLEDFYIGKWSGLKFPTEPQTHLITYWIQAWTFHMDLDVGFHRVATDIFASLIINGDLALGIDFLPFVPETPWALYLTGRLYLLVSQLEDAVTYFQAASDGLAERTCLVSDQLLGHELLDSDDRECLNKGHSLYYLHINSLFERAKAYGIAAVFARDGLNALAQEERHDPKLHTELSSRLFASTLKTSQFSVAFTTLAQHTDHALRDSSLRAWISALLTTNDIDTLINTPYSKHGLSSLADATISSLAAKPTAQTPKIPYHKILYSFRLQQNDLRGAASCLWDRLQHLRQSQDAGFRGEDVDEEVAECYLALLNCLSLVTPEQAWILYRPLASKSEDDEKPKRTVVTLFDVRRAWQEELDRVADVAAGRFAIGGAGWGMNGSGRMPGSFRGNSEGMEIDAVG